ncbi:VRR-NUC domain-containing protein, partial [Sphaerisporangium sp. NPDC049002]|uniref:VRR-NUC domain-containing protein n=1 Tax=Sphaerisporangium sp. NPDC049002 TaxID=3155392 RepID=UPI00340DDDEB
YGLGLWFIHMPDGTGMYNPGIPDLVIVGHGKILWRELKSESGRTSAEQRAFIERLRCNGADVDVWRPRDLLSRRIHRELEAISGPPVVRARERERCEQYRIKARVSTARVAGRRRKVRRAAGD